MRTQRTWIAAAVGMLLSVSAIGRAAPAPSLYDFNDRFTDQDGKAVTLEDLSEGHPLLISMFYGTCPAACPLLINEIHRLEAKLTPQERAQVRVVLVTLDPKRDDVAALAKIRTQRGLDKDRWTLVRTDDAGVVRSLAAVLGVKYRFLPGGMINHSSVITYVAPNGTLGPRMDGLDADDGAVLAAVRSDAR